LVFPAALIGLAFLSLALMMISTASNYDPTPAWKSSILPLLYLQEAHLNTKLGDYLLKNMERNAQANKVELKRDGQQRWRLVFVDKQETKFSEGTPLN
jgi:hypothetical protein